LAALQPLSVAEEKVWHFSFTPVTIGLPKTLFLVAAIPPTAVEHTLGFEITEAAGVSVEAPATVGGAFPLTTGTATVVAPATGLHVAGNALIPAKVGASGGSMIQTLKLTFSSYGGASFPVSGLQLLQTGTLPTTGVKLRIFKDNGDGAFVYGPDQPLTGDVAIDATGKGVLTFATQTITPTTPLTLFVTAALPNGLPIGGTFGVALTQSMGVFTPAFISPTELPISAQTTVSSPYLQVTGLSV
jgi:hypothetical protein